MTARNKFIMLLLFFGIAVTAATFAIQFIPQDWASALSSLLVAVATMALVGAGFWTYQENKRLVSEMVNDRGADHIRRQIMELHSTVLNFEKSVMDSLSNATPYSAYAGLLNLRIHSYYLAGPQLRAAADQIIGNPFTKVAREEGTVSFDFEGSEASLRNLSSAAREEMETLSDEYAKIVSTEVEDQWEHSKSFSNWWAIQLRWTSTNGTTYTRSTVSL